MSLGLTASDGPVLLSADPASGAVVSGSPLVLRLQFSRALDNGTFVAGSTVRLTYSDVNARVNRIANGLRKLGVDRGDRISLLMANSAEMACVALAANKLGAIWVPINTSFKASWLRDAIELARVSVLVVDADLYDLAAPDVPAGKHVVLTAA